MYIQQLYTNCLAQAAYYVESDREALVIDPLRDPAPYLEIAKSRGATIKFILESHFHADFVSGHLDLAKATKAEIVFGPEASPSYPAHIAKDGERLPLGNLEIEIIHTPGHTIESACFLLYDEVGQPHTLFSGDTLFAGDVGRPDLLSGNFDAVTLAGRLYDSIQKLKKLPDNVLVYPGHGAGSPCGKNIGKETLTTIGQQRKSNYAMQDMPKETFIPLVTQGQPVPPMYFFSDAKLNKTGYDSYSSVVDHAMHFMEAPEFDRLKREGLTVLDTRNPADFGKGFVPGSINIGLNGDFAIWLGTLFAFGTEFLLVTDEGKESESIERMARIGFDKIRGILKGGANGWLESGRPLDRIPSLDPLEFSKHLETTKYAILDVRRPGEVEQKKLRSAVNLNLANLPEKIHRLDQGEQYIICCAGGYRSMIAASMMKASGIETVMNVDGGVARLMKEKPELIEEAVVG